MYPKAHFPRIFFPQHLPPERTYQSISSSCVDVVLHGLSVDRIVDVSNALRSLCDKAVGLVDKENEFKAFLPELLVEYQVEMIPQLKGLVDEIKKITSFFHSQYTALGRLAIPPLARDLLDPAVLTVSRFLSECTETTECINADINKFEKLKLPKGGDPTLFLEDYLGCMGSIKNYLDIAKREATSFCRTLEITFPPLERATKVSHVISKPSPLLLLRISDNSSSSMAVTRLMYSNTGLALLGLTAKAVHKLWIWPENVGKATLSVTPQTWQTEPIECFALSENDSKFVSASGGMIAYYKKKTFKGMKTFMPPESASAATFLAFHPQDTNIIAIGMDDSSILIYNLRDSEVKSQLTGHNKRITGLAFSNRYNVLVSSGADSQLFVWSTDGWENQRSKQLQIPGGGGAPFGDTHVQFHQNQRHFLVGHQTQIAIYKISNLKCKKQWTPREASGGITHAAYSCDSKTIYVALKDASIDVLIASSLEFRCRISSAAYLPSNLNSRDVYPLVVATHPSEPNQFALGLTNGGVIVIEPFESDEKWWSLSGVEDGAGSST